MTTCVEIHDPSYYLLLPWLPDERRQKKLPWIKPLAVGYTLLLSWQLIGTCLYLIRGVACFKKESTAFLCESNTAFPYSEIFTIAWLFTLSVLVIILMVALQNVSGFPGCKIIFYQLKFLPSFWTLILLLFLCLSRYVELMLVHKSLVSLVILIALSLSYILRTAAIGFLNYTQLNFLKSGYPTYIFVLSKVTIFVLFIVSLVNLLATLLALTVEVHQMKKSPEAENALNLEKFNDLLRDFGAITYRFQLMSFFWQKLLIDDRNILSNHVYLT